MNKFILALGAIIFLTQNVMADYHVATFGDKSFSANKETRVIVVGAGDDLGLLFQEVAKAKALRYKQVFPNDQVLVIANEEKNLNSLWSLKRYGFNVLRDEKGKFNSKNLLKELRPVTKIKSLDIFSHSSDQFGLYLSGRAFPLTENTEGVSALRSNFTKDAYALLHGCNNGFSIATGLSRVWGLPVAGSLTSSDFEKLHSDGEFYRNNEGQYPNSQWAKVNSMSFDKEVSCAEGGCMRMKPDNHAYVGFWGNYREGGLPFYKFFCLSKSDVDCRKAMAKSMLGHTLKVNLNKNSSFEDYKKGVADYLCPVSSKSDLKRNCEEELNLALDSGEETYNPFPRPQLECDFKGCMASIDCDKTMIKNIVKPGSCILKNKAPKKASTIVREYKEYLKAYEYLAL